MKQVYFIVPSKDFLPSQTHMNQIIQAGVTIESIIHTGKLADLGQLKSDDTEKIIAVDPDFCNWELDTETLGEIPNVLALCASTASYDWTNPGVLEKLKIPLTNVPGFNADSVAEYAVCMAIEVARRLPMVIKNNWGPISDLNGPFLLKGKKAGVIGLGRVGTRLAEILQGIGMDVVYWSKRSEDERFMQRELQELFSESDLIIPAIVVNDETKQLISHALIDQIKTRAVLVGINRTRELWDEEYIINKVESGELGGYAYEGEQNISPETYKGNVWALPPIAWMTKDSMENLEQIWTDSIISVCNGEPQNVVSWLPGYAQS